ncbi:MAG: AAA family ATPase, partial [Campylobacterota bacterium]|nr:AAA family ATPase [Campylobacterota bacterium]
MNNGIDFTSRGSKRHTMNLKKHTILTHNLLKYYGADESAELIQTHISTIILSDNFVYKLKKPVDFGFLDYSTLNKRHKYCLEEIRINEKYAPTLYLGVVSITGSIEAPQIDGEGQVLDYAVKMHRFSQQDQLDNIVDHSGLEIEMMDKIAKLVAHAHNNAAPVDKASDFGEPKQLLNPMLENFDLLKSIATEDALSQELSSIITWTHKQFEILKPQLQHRKKQGFIRECHGDMHLHNMALYEGDLILFDAIEFNPYLNHIDVISDLSFLLMDLEYRGLTHHSYRLLNHYLELTGDYEAVALLDFYKTYRAMVRAKVAALRITQERDNEVLRVLADEVKKYMELAQIYTGKKKPSMGITHGFSGSGKSTFSLMMVEQYGAVRIRSDRERMRMFESAGEESIYTADATKLTYEHLLTLAISVYNSGYSVIVDATFLKQWQRELFLKQAAMTDIPLHIYTMKCDLALMQSRIKKRSQEDSDISEADLEILQKQLLGAEPLLESEKELAVTIDCSSMVTMHES